MSTEDVYTLRCSCLPDVVFPFLSEGFPERTGQRHRRLHQRGGDLSSFTSLLLVLASVWVIRIFQILTKKLLSSVSDDPEEF